MIPVEPLQAAVARSGLSWCEVARRAGFNNPSHLKRTLGVTIRMDGRTSKAGERYRYYSRRCSYENALRVARAIDADPVDLGL